MKILDKINLPITWNAGAIAAVLGIIGIVLSNTQAVSEVLTLLSSAPLPTKVAALGILAGIVATAIGKPPLTSPPKG